MAYGGDLQQAAGVREGDILAGKYRIERVLGRGGMGVVVAAHHLQLDEKVAIKLMLPEALGHPEAVARFLREARAAVKIKSEHVASVKDVGTLPDGAPYMVMEYLEGGDLAAWLKQRGPLPIEQAIEFVLQACVAVADAHALGIVHRDLKPANLFCIRRSDGQLAIKVLDFGISKVTEGAAAGMAMTRTSALMGTPLYMSPEQMRASRDVDATTDLWALGVILFELLAGKPPFFADSVTELVMKVASDPPLALRTFRPDAAPGLEAVISKCLEKDRRWRYRSVGELALALLPFGPKRAKASVERISGILQAAGLSQSALAVPASPPVSPSEVETQVPPGTLPAVGRSTFGAPRRSSKTLGLVSAGVLVVAGAIAGLVTLARHGGEAFAPQPATASPAVAPAGALPGNAIVPAAAVLPPLASAASSPSASSGPPSPTPGLDQTPTPPEAPTPAQALTSRRAAAPTPIRTNLSHPGTPTPVDSPMGSPMPRTISTPGPTPAPPAQPPASADCNPPYVIDANGDRQYKPECLRRH